VLTLPHWVLSAMQMQNSSNSHPSTDYVNMINVLFNFGVWGNYIYEGVPFLVNLVFNKLTFLYVRDCSHLFYSWLAQR
jgi:hypothetical protein